ncbi:MAG: hypothetical protein EA397_13360 [Deltaproteobacteria bacterium]|nr:MAG: hypothetical protein EA397_13360 [Deltaproteobacteria bacterium]
MIRNALLLASLMACASPDPSGRAEPYYDPDSGEIFDAPWPTDDRFDGEGLDLSGFPGEGQIPLLDRYLGAASQLPGWGTSSTHYLPVRSLPDQALLPAPLESVEADSALQLLNIDPTSPHRGTRIPVQWELIPSGTYNPRAVLAIAPVFGFPLDPNTRHALLLTTQAARPHPDYAERLIHDPDWRDLRETLDLLDLDPEAIAVGSVFTTRDPLEEMDRWVRASRALPTPPLSQRVVELNTRTRHHTFEATLPAPLWMHGEKPFATSGGEFRTDEDGHPSVADWEDLRLAISMPPNAPDDQPERGYPVVIYGHGTGGSFSGFAGGDQPRTTASLLAEAGIVGIGYDQPLHGTRGVPGTDTDLHSFNYLNPESARAGFRQGALDILWIVQTLQAAEPVLTLPDGRVVRLDPEQISFVGHSHGGLTGAIALPWLSDSVRSAVLSGAGGGLAITIVKRKDPLDIAELIGQVLRLGPDEELSPLHPLVGLVQLLVEETDPINYGPAWHAEDRGYAHRTTHTLLTSGAHDEQTDHETAEALAIAARLPPILPAWNVTDGFELRGLSTREGPASRTIEGYDGRSLTCGLSQWSGGDHFVIFRDDRASDMWVRFVRTSFGTSAPIIDP